MKYQSLCILVPQADTMFSKVAFFFKLEQFYREGVRNLLKQYSSIDA